MAETMPDTKWLVMIFELNHCQQKMQSRSREATNQETVLRLLSMVTGVEKLSAAFE